MSSDTPDLPDSSRPSTPSPSALLSPADPNYESRASLRRKHRRRSNIIVSTVLLSFGLITALTVSLVLVNLLQRPTVDADEVTPTLNADEPPPKLLPYANATVNQKYFDYVVLSLIETQPNSTGPQIVDALVAAGFDKAAMQLTDDTTSIGLDAGSIQFSVLWQGQCIIGQFGDASNGYRSTVTQQLPGGLCLVGTTRPINW